MRRNALLILLILLAGLHSSAQQTRYLIRFKNKGNSPFSFSAPTLFLSQRAIDRRTRYQLPLDSTDLPVTPAYLAAVAGVPNVVILNTSKWLNQVSIQTTDAGAISTIQGFPFVQTVSGIAARTFSPGLRKQVEPENGTPIRFREARIAGISGSNYYNYGDISFNEMHLHQGEFLHNIGLHGENMQLAMLDAGFYKYNSFAVFDSMNINGQVLGTWDFVARDPAVAEDNSHGMSCLSTIAANLPGQFIGTAPKTSFYLYRTEDVNSEYPIEEHNWVCGAEKADSSGADVISSSLGYSTFDDAGFNHSYADLNGQSTLAAKGAALAAAKGLLVFIAAGNEGNSAWHYIMTPADADNIIAVGAVDTNGVKGSFSSFGPTPDGRIKPDAVSVGLQAIIETSYNAPGISQGTSFACPKLAGLGTCLLQGFPEFNPQKIIKALRQSGNSFNHPTDSLGYGIPDLKQAFILLLTDFASSAVSFHDCTASISWSSKDAGNMKYEIGRMVSGETGYTKIGELNPVPGMVLANHSYQFMDSLLHIPGGPVSYQIKQVVDTSTGGYAAAYIDTCQAMLNTGCLLNPVTGDFPRLTVSPNPAGSTIHLFVESPDAIPHLLIRLFDMQGRLMKEIAASLPAGKTGFTIPASRFAKGKYTLVAYDAQKRIAGTGLIKL